MSRDKIMELITHVIAERRWKNGHLVVMAQEFVNGNDIKVFLDLDDKWIKKKEHLFPGLKEWYNGHL